MVNGLLHMPDMKTTRMHYCCDAKGTLVQLAQIQLCTLAFYLITLTIAALTIANSALTLPIIIM